MFLKSTALIVFQLLLIQKIVLGNQELEFHKITANHKIVEINQNLKSISLISQNNDLFIEFKPLKGNTVHYKYYLEGYEMDTTSTAYPLVRYMNLHQGDFKLHFLAYDHNKIINQIYLPVKVEKSIAEIWWFYPMLTLYGLLLIGGGIYLFFLYNFRQKMKLQKLRNKIAADLHDEVGSTLNSIGISSKIIQKKLNTISPELKEIITQIGTDSEETINTIRDTVWALNSENDSLNTLIEKLKIFSTQLLDHKGIRLIFENQINQNKLIKLGIEQQKNFYMMAKEAVNNIAKHSEASLAEIKFSHTKSGVLFEIADNGKGFDKSKIFEGNGLKNFERRAEESFMDLTIESELGKGTKLSLQVPVL
ncbi:MAG: histidine kinase [Bacteroidota bacterium]